MPTSRLVLSRLRAVPFTHLPLPCISFCDGTLSAAYQHLFHVVVKINLRHVASMTAYWYAAVSKNSTDSFYCSIKSVKAKVTMCPGFHKILMSTTCPEKITVLPGLPFIPFLAWCSGFVPICPSLQSYAFMHWWPKIS